MKNLIIIKLKGKRDVLSRKKVYQKIKLECIEYLLHNIYKNYILYICNIIKLKFK